MNKLFVIACLVLASCGDGEKADKGCTVVDNENGTATILCDDGSHVLIENGQSGADGSPCTVNDNQDGTATITCPDGTEATIGVLRTSNLVDFYLYTVGASGEIFIDGQSIGIFLNGSPSNPIVVTVDRTLGHVISFGDVAGFVTPGDIVVPAYSIGVGDNSVFFGAYVATCYRSFKDVPCEAWYFDYVEQLVDQGIIDAGEYFRPNDPLSRAELVKMVVTTIDGLADYVAPATPTFDDVPVSAWYYDYVEAAVQLGIISGYTDASGNLTGQFGPGDSVGRAAATKILVNAFAIPTTLSPASPFADVVPGQWFHDWVLTAYNQSVVDGFADGLFHPSDLLTRAHMAKWLVNAQNPTPRNP